MGEKVEKLLKELKETDFSNIFDGPEKESPLGLLKIVAFTRYGSAGIAFPAKLATG